MVKENKEGLGNCGICHLIVRHVDDYVKVEDYIKGQLKSTVYFHRVCFRKRLAPEMKGIEEMVKNLAFRTDKLLSEVGH